MSNEKSNEEFLAIHTPANLNISAQTDAFAAMSSRTPVSSSYDSFDLPENLHSPTQGFGCDYTEKARSHPRSFNNAHFAGAAQSTSCLSPPCLYQTTSSLATDEELLSWDISVNLPEDRPLMPLQDTILKESFSMPNLVLATACTHASGIAPVDLSVAHASLASQDQLAPASERADKHQSIGAAQGAEDATNGQEFLFGLCAHDAGEATEDQIELVFASLPWGIEPQSYTEMEGQYYVHSPSQDYYWGWFGSPPPNSLLLLQPLDAETLPICDETVSFSAPVQDYGEGPPSDNGSPARPKKSVGKGRKTSNRVRRRTRLE